MFQTSPSISSFILITLSLSRSTARTLLGLRIVQFPLHYSCHPPRGSTAWPSTNLSVYCWSKIFVGLDCWQVDHCCHHVSLHPNRISVPCCLYVFGFRSFKLFFSIHSLHLSSLSSIITLSGSHNTRSSANSIAQGIPSSISSVITSIMITNNRVEVLGSANSNHDHILTLILTLVRVDCQKRSQSG